MQIWQTLEHMAYQNIYDEIFYDGTVPRYICQHVENCGKPMNPPIQHGATRIKSLSCPLTCSPRNLDRPRGTNARGGNKYLKHLRMIDGINLQDPQR